MVNEKLDKRFYFVITTDKAEGLRPAKLPKEYEPWFDHICKLHFISLDKYRQFRKHIDEKELRQELNNLASEIIKTKENLLKDILYEQFLEQGMNT